LMVDAEEVSAPVDDDIMEVINIEDDVDIIVLSDDDEAKV
jgi:hypothetical protein